VSSGLIEEVISRYSRITFETVRDRLPDLGAPPKIILVIPEVGFDSGFTFFAQPASTIDLALPARCTVKDKNNIESALPALGD
jgi:hypothetical protein